jgi:hypothetical protein
MIIVTFVRALLEIIDEATELRRECLRRYPYVAFES